MSSVRREARRHIPSATGTHLKEVIGLPTYRRSKDRRDKSMLGERRGCQKALVWQATFDPADMAKAELPESQSPVVNVTT